MSLIVTGVAWRWMFNPTLGVQNFLHSVGLTGVDFNWLASSETAMHGIFLASIWQGPGFYMALMLSGLKSIHTEIWSAARLSLGVVKAYDIVVAMTQWRARPIHLRARLLHHQRPLGQVQRGYASAAAVIMLLITGAIFLSLVLRTAWRERARAERVA